MQPNNSTPTVSPLKEDSRLLFSSLSLPSLTPWGLGGRWHEFINTEMLQEVHLGTEQKIQEG